VAQALADFVNHRPLPEAGNPDGAETVRTTKWETASKTGVGHISTDREAVKRRTT
jgi:hypothetical protein